MILGFCPNHIFLIYLNPANAEISYVLLPLNQTWLNVRTEGKCFKMDASVLWLQYCTLLKQNYQNPNALLSAVDVKLLHIFLLQPSTAFLMLSPDIVLLFGKHDYVSSHRRWDTKPFWEVLSHTVNLAGGLGANTQTNQQTVIFHCLSPCILMTLID